VKMNYPDGKRYVRCTVCHDIVRVLLGAPFLRSQRLICGVWGWRTAVPLGRSELYLNEHWIGVGFQDINMYNDQRTNSIILLNSDSMPVPKSRGRLQDVNKLFCDETHI
jgi:LSD1 subclass zinc finger protein